MKWNKKKIIKKLFSLEKKLKRRPTKHDHANLYFLSRKYFGSWNNLMKAAGYKVKNFQDPKIPSLDENSLYYFLGLLSTDGHILFDEKNKKYKVMLFTSEEKEKDLIINLIKYLFNYNASIRYKKYGYAKKINYEIYISSKKLCEYLIKELDMPFGSKSLTIRISKIVINNKEENIFHFIRGVFDGDGSMINTKKAKMFKIFSGSIGFIEDLNNLLIKLGFNSVKIRQERKNLWVLKINKKDDIKRIYELLYKNSKKYYYPRKRNNWVKQYI